MPRRWLTDGLASVCALLIGCASCSGEGKWCHFAPWPRLLENAAPLHSIHPNGKRRKKQDETRERVIQGTSRPVWKDPFMPSGFVACTCTYHCNSTLLQRSGSPYPCSPSMLS
ncbi:hypothetical protein M419DRAFT_121481 [Trichoderma reesei RUT C-30]|uniref:Secreted protein n=1 Tax=Hypocrea jecorina (strain ATCC 56765 / BCRC 32924 / NRRL 11460 / Rut C-30) TaxID=1344414 RepID=A0A024SJV3_HYPJR|nr:hypothetical protein M419DRAFT_121481 [Trichoderma reesei RUT C-30]